MEQQHLSAGCRLTRAFATTLAGDIHWERSNGSKLFVQWQAVLVKNPDAAGTYRARMELLISD